MNLKERLKAAMEKMAEIKEAVEKGEKSADELAACIEEVKGLQAQVKAADEAEQLINSLGPVNVLADTEEQEPTYKSVGEYAAAMLKKAGANAKSKFNVTAAEFKAAGVMKIPSSIQPALTDVDTRIVEGYRRPLLIADLFATERVLSLFL